MDDPAFTDVDRGVLGLGIRSLAQKTSQRNAKENVSIGGKAAFFE
jgi:hypothetical protein